MNANTTISHASMRASARPAASSFGMLDTMADWWSAVMRRSQARRDERFLLSQPDHLLRDIGIARAEITAAVSGKIER